MLDLNDVLVEFDVPARMRDGVTLRADVYRPKQREALPVLLMRIPYNKRHAEHGDYAHPSWYARQGYIVVVQDTRGRWASEGDFTPYLHEMADGYDSVEWAARLPGANGKVGMYGFSYPGAVQLLAAIMRPPHLTCIVPGFTASQFYEGWTFTGGALNLAFVLSWAVYLAIDTAHRRGFHELERELVGAHPRLSEQFHHLPLADLPLLKAIRPLAPYFFDWLDHPTYDDYWKQWSIDQHYSAIRVPALHIGGWYDSFREGTIRNFLGIRASGADEQTRQGQRLIVGPWFHDPWRQITGEIDFGAQAANIVNSVQMNWFNRWLKGIPDPEAEADNSVRLFVMGSNHWQSFGEFPPRGVNYGRLYLHSPQGNAATPDGDGVLSRERPGDDPPNVYTYDPRAPVASLGGHSCCVAGLSPMGPADQRAIEYQGQVLVFTSEILDEALTVIGPCVATLWVATSAADTDFTVKLVDVHPDGRAINVTEGILRARYRAGFDTPLSVTPYEVMKMTIEVGNTAYRFHAGHSVRVEISSSNFPHWDRNTNSGNVPVKDGYSEMVVATQVLFHDHQHPSHLDLPIL